MADEARGYLIRQFATAWKLTSLHLDGLATEECLWRPAREGLHVHQVPDGRWRADWPDREHDGLSGTGRSVTSSHGSMSNSRRTPPRSASKRDPLDGALDIAGQSMERRRR